MALVMFFFCLRLLQNVVYVLCSVLVSGSVAKSCLRMLVVSSLSEANSQKYGI